MFLKTSATNSVKLWLYISFSLFNEQKREIKIKEKFVWNSEFDILQVFISFDSSNIAVNVVH